MKGKKGVLQTVSFLVVIAVFSIGTVILPDRDFSNNENRSLQTFPSFSLNSVMSGESQSQFNSYTSDQVPFRDGLIGVKTAVQKAAGNRDIGNVYICHDGYYMEKLTYGEKSQKIFGANVEAFNKFFGMYSGKITGKTAFGIIPTAAEVLPEKLPANAEDIDQSGLISFAYKKISNAVKIDFLSALKEVKNAAYYKTDHHWTAVGAYSAYNKYCKTLKLTPASDYKPQVVSSNFRGTLFSKVVDFKAPYDEITLYRYIGDTNYKVEADGKKINGIYDKSFLSKKDKYSLFLSGNHAKVTITGGKGNGNLLLIRDSFCSSLVPMLLRNYKSITLIDTRYFKIPLSAEINAGSYTDISVICSIENLASDPSFGIIVF